MLNDLEMFWVYLQTRFESFIVWYGMMIELIANWILIPFHVIVVILLVAFLYFAVVGIKKKIGDVKK